MMSLLHNCCVCINNNEGLISISASDTNQVQWSYKLNKCVPEVDWNHDYFICPKCILQLEIVYNFYNLCLQSYTVRQQQKFTVKIEAEEIPDVIELENNEDIVSHQIYVKETDVKEFMNTEEFGNTNDDEPDSCDEDSSSSDDGGAQATLNSLHVKSRLIYDRAHREFQKWLKANKANPKCITENLLLAYFSELSEAQKSSSLWSKFSMLKSTLMVNNNIDIKKFDKLLSFLRRTTRGHKPKKSKAFDRQDILKFLRDAPDEIYLMKKVAVIIGIAGRCRLDELAYLEKDSVQDMGSALLITLKDTITKIQRSFTVVNNQESNFPDMLDIYRRYVKLRPAHTYHNRLFVQYLKGKCTTQVVGINAIAKIPSQIAKYLNLPEPLTYTGHSIRKTSATILALSNF